MKVYGLKIANVGIEFSVLTDRQKALEMFTKGSSTTINESSGPVYKEGEAIFGTYERETKETLVRCECCKTIQSIESCTKRDYPSKYSWKNEWEVSNNYICDGCLAKAVKDKEVFDAKKLLKQE